MPRVEVVIYILSELNDGIMSNISKHEIVKIDIYYLKAGITICTPPSLAIVTSQVLFLRTHWNKQVSRNMIKYTIQSRYKLTRFT